MVAADGDSHSLGVGFWFVLRPKTSACYSTLLFLSLFATLRFSSYPLAGFPIVTSTLALSALALVACIAATVEGVVHRRRLCRIPIRIHVNGTRGKSSVTRLIAAGLRAGGITTCAKTTGTDAVMIFGDGAEVPIHRPGRANVTEQKRVVRAAVAEGADALVIECMALQPLLQSVCELRFVRATHGVITNARADHLDVMGPTRLDVARALAGTTPVAGTLFTAEDRADSLAVLQAACSDRGSRLNVTGVADAESISCEDLAGFSYLEHAENVALALSVCGDVGVDRETALRGMWAATPDIGAMRIHSLTAGETSQWRFVNALAANDPESTERIWGSVGRCVDTAAARILLMNCRGDRIERSVSMAAAAATWAGVDYHFVIGSGTEHYVRALTRGGVARSRIVVVEDDDPHAIARELYAATLGRDVDVVGVGNIKGPGLALAEFFADRDRWPDIDPECRVSRRPADAWSQSSATTSAVSRT